MWLKLFFDVCLVREVFGKSGNEGTPSSAVGESLMDGLNASSAVGESLMDRLNATLGTKVGSKGSSTDCSDDSGTIDKVEKKEHHQQGTAGLSLNTTPRIKFTDSEGSSTVNLDHDIGAKDTQTVLTSKELGKSGKKGVSASLMDRLKFAESKRSSTVHANGDTRTQLAPTEFGKSGNEGLLSSSVGGSPIRK